MLSEYISFILPTSAFIVFAVTVFPTVKSLSTVASAVFNVPVLVILPSLVISPPLVKLPVLVISPPLVKLPLLLISPVLVILPPFTILAELLIVAELIVVVLTTPLWNVGAIAVPSLCTSNALLLSVVLVPLPTLNEVLSFVVLLY